MDKFLDIINNKVGGIANKIAAQKHLIAIRDGLILLMPITIVASIFIIIGELPIAGYQNFMVGLLGEDFWYNFVWGMVYPATLGLSAVIAVIGIAYNFVHNEGIDGLPAGIIALASYFILLDGIDGISAYCGAEGLFVALIVGLLTGEIYVRLVKKDIVIHLPDSVPPTIMRSFVALIPATLVIFLFFAVRLAFAATSFGTVHSFIMTVLQAPLMNVTSSFFGTLITSLANSALWLFGLHGDSIVGSVTESILTSNYLANVDAHIAGQLPPYINCSGFGSLFLNFGGTGSILGLVLAMKLACKSKTVKKISNVSLVPSIFNISEPVMFGLPIVLNPIMMIPFILVTITTCSVAYGAFALNLVNRIIVSPPWTTPIFISGYLATGGDFRAIILQIVLLAISFFIYLPFVKILDNNYLESENA